MAFDVLAYALCILVAVRNVYILFFVMNICGKYLNLTAAAEI